MALTPTQEAQVLQLVAEQAALLSLADNEATIISKLGATKVNLSSLGSAATFGDSDLMLLRQGTTDLSIAGSVVKAAVAVPDASETVKGKVELATSAETVAGTDNTRAVHPAGLSSALAGVGAAVVGAFSNLAASATGASAVVTITADELVVKGTAGYKTLSAVSVNPSLAASGANGLDTGTSTTNTWYSVFVIWNGTTTAGLLSLSATAPTMPSGYTHKAKIGDIKSDGTANKYPIAFIQTGKKYYWITPPIDISASSPGVLRNNYTISVPTGYRVTVKLNGWISGDNCSMYVSSPEFADLVPGISGALGVGITTASAVDDSGNYIQCLTNTSRQISVRCFGPTVNAIYFSTIGWEYQ